MIHLENVTKVYQAPGQKVRALDNVTVDIEKGEFVIVHGPSGSGKTTLLMTIAGMLKPSAGTVLVKKQNLYTLSPQERASFRAANVGFVFQMFHLIPYFNVIENIRLAAVPCRKHIPKNRIDNLIDKLNLGHRIRHVPGRLSSGEKQRVAFARAMLNEPVILLADEPTGNLDPAAAEVVLADLADYNKNGGTVLLVTHSCAAERFATRTIQLKSGQVVS